MSASLVVAIVSTSVAVVTLVYFVVDRQSKKQNTRIEEAIRKATDPIQPAITAAVVPLNTRLAVVEYELRANGGKSLRDKVVGLEASVLTLGLDLSTNTAMTAAIRKSQKETGEKEGSSGG